MLRFYIIDLLIYLFISNAKFYTFILFLKVYYILYKVKKYNKIFLSLLYYNIISFIYKIFIFIYF